jgi:hypothetical protein
MLIVYWKESETTQGTPLFFSKLTIQTLFYRNLAVFTQKAEKWFSFLGFKVHGFKKILLLNFYQANNNLDNYNKDNCNSLFFIEK